MTTMTLPALVQQFFTDRLSTQMDASPNTIAGYRDTFRLLLRFASEQSRKAPTRLRIEDLRTGHVGYLDALELETLAWLPEGALHPLLDPSLHRWREDGVLDRRP